MYKAVVRYPENDFYKKFYKSLPNNSWLNFYSLQPTFGVFVVSTNGWMVDPKFLTDIELNN